LTFLLPIPKYQTFSVVYFIIDTFLLSDADFLLPSFLEMRSKIVSLADFYDDILIHLLTNSVPHCQADHFLKFLLFWHFPKNQAFDVDFVLDLNIIYTLKRGRKWWYEKFNQVVVPFWFCRQFVSILSFSVWTYHALIHNPQIPSVKLVAVVCIFCTLAALGSALLLVLLTAN